MPTLTRQHIVEVSRGILRAVGAPEAHATTVATHLADANLTGHDSHGIIRVLQYVKEIREGKLFASAEPAIVRRTNAAASVDGRWTFGQVAATLAVDEAIKLARDHGVSIVTICNAAHTGRIGAYPEAAARQGLAAIMCTGLWGGPISRVAPFGGRQPRLGTNPMAMAFPYRAGAPFVLDFATSVAAEGKFRVYRARGEQLPERWVIRGDGAPSADPNDLYDGGSMLPLGGLVGGHKGYALSLMVSLLGGVLGRTGCDTTGNSATKSGSSIIAIDLDHIAPRSEIAAEVDALIEFVKDTPLMEGAEGIFYPGEVEARTRERRAASGVAVEDSTWDPIKRLLEEFDLADELAVVS